MILVYRKSIKWKQGKYIILGNRVNILRYSPTLIVIWEACSERITNKAQEPRLTATLAQDKLLIQSFIDGKDVYASIASIAFNVPYENCLEFHPETHEYQPDGKKRRNEAKTILLGEPIALCPAYSMY